MANIESLTFTNVPLDTLGLLPLTTYSGNLNVDYDTGAVTGSLQVAPALGISLTNYSNFTLTQGVGDTYTITGTGQTAGLVNSTITIQYNGTAPTSVSTQYYAAGVELASGTNGPVTSVAVCYVTGTLITTVRGDVPVEKLVIGDVVVTAFGRQRPIKWIGHRAYAARFANTSPDILPVCIKAGALDDNVPARDLYVSPKHALYLDGVLIPAEMLVNDVSVIKINKLTRDLEYWHVELDSHDVLLAEGAAAESYVDDDNRGIFQNALTFRKRYPMKRRTDATYCASRVASGYTLERVRSLLAARAGLAAPAARAFGALRGNLDYCERDAGGLLVSGWAQDEAYPDAPVCLDIVIGGRVVALAYADAYRADLQREGIGDGCHAFSVSVPADLSQSVMLEVRRSADRQQLGMHQIAPRKSAA